MVGEENSPGGAVKTHTASWDAVIVDNDPVNLYFHDLTQVDTREDPDTGELLVLDKKEIRCALRTPLPAWHMSMMIMAVCWHTRRMMREIRYWSNPYRY